MFEGQYLFREENTLNFSRVKYADERIDNDSPERSKSNPNPEVDLNSLTPINILLAL